MDRFERMQRRMELEHGRSDWVMPAVLLLVGLPCMLIAFYMAGEEFLFRRAAQRVPGMVVEVTDGTPSLVVEYAVAGEKHRVESFGSDLYADVKVGDTVGVFVDPVRPQQGRLDFFTAAWMLPAILGAFGSFFGIPGLMFLRGLRRRPRFDRQPKEIGMPVQARVLEIRPVLDIMAFRNREAQGKLQCEIRRDGDGWRLTVNGEEQDPFAPHANREWGVAYSVIAQWQDAAGKTHECEGEPVDTDPSFYLQFGTVTVLVDPEDPDNCEVDMSFLPGRQAKPEYEV